jgi:inhibitor of cysteine peptidase
VSQSARSPLSGEVNKLALLTIALAGIAIIVVVAKSLLGGDVTSGQFPAEVQVSETSNGGVVKLARGGVLIVALASNPSTGFSWRLDERSSTGIQIIETRYVPPGSTGPILGAPGTEVMTFKASEEGTARLVLEYRRGFEPGLPAEQTFRLTIEVR